jgi:hypothetical protein
MLTFIACCIKSIAISRPNSSPVRRVNRLIMEHAPRTASKKSNSAVQTHTLKHYLWKRKLISFCISYKPLKEFERYHPVQGRNSLCPKSSRSFAKLYMNVYIRTVGSATPSMRRGWPPIIEWIIPHSAVDARVWTAVRVPSV